MVEVVLAEAAGPGVPSNHPYVRRFWVAAIGPGAVTDLLRLAVAARKGTSLPRPLYLSVLLTSGLVRVEQGRVLVPTVVPLVPPQLRRRLPPPLRNEHRRWELALRSRPPKGGER